MTTLAGEPSTDLGFDLSAIELRQQRLPFAMLRRERPISSWGPVTLQTIAPARRPRGAPACRGRGVRPKPAVGEPVPLVSTRIDGVKRLQFSLSR
jgi:hypothetical protein